MFGYGCLCSAAREGERGRGRLEREREREREKCLTCPSVRCGNYPGNVNTSSPPPLPNKARHWSSQENVCVCVCVYVCLPRSPRELLKKKTKKRSNPTLGRHTEKKNPLQFFFLPSSVLPHHRRTSDVKIYILIIPSTG